jgi:hypothetical protein
VSDEYQRTTRSLRHSHEVLIDGLSHWVSHSHKVNPERWSHHHYVTAASGISATFLALGQAGIDASHESERQ